MKKDEQIRRKEIKRINMHSDRRVNLLINVLAIIIILVGFLICVYFIDYGIFETFKVNSALKIIVLLISLYGYFIVHEVIHAVFYKLFTNAKVTLSFHVLMLSSDCKEGVFKKWEYVIIALAPVFVISITLMLMWRQVTLDWLWVLGLLQIENVAGAIPDFYSVKEVLFGPKESIINDDGENLIFLVFDDNNTKEEI